MRDFDLFGSTRENNGTGHGWRPSLSSSRRQVLFMLKIVIGSILVGVAVSVLFKSKAAVPVAALIAWLLLLAYLLFNEYVLPYRGGGASMWPVAQLVGGTVAAVVAAVSCALVRRIRQ
jgi:hypothetical protein